MLKTYYPGPVTVSSSGFTPPPAYAGVVALAARSYGVPENVLAAQIEQESGYNPSAVSSAGAVGIAQFEPGTAASLGVNPNDPNSSIMGMAKYDSQLLRQFGSVPLMLAAYNAGPDAVTAAGNSVPENGQTPSYVNNILSLSGSGGSLTNSDIGTTSASGAGGTFAIVKMFDSLVSGSFWVRVGKGALGLIIVLIGFYAFTKNTGPVRTVTKVAKKAGRDAAVAAVA